MYVCIYLYTYMCGWMRVNICLYRHSKILTLDVRLCLQCPVNSSTATLWRYFSLAGWVFLTPFPTPHVYKATPPWLGRRPAGRPTGWSAGRAGGRSVSCNTNWRSCDDDYGIISSKCTAVAVASSCLQRFCFPVCLSTSCIKVVPGAIHPMV